MMHRTVTLGWRSLGLIAFALIALGSLLGMLAVGFSRADNHEPGASSAIRVYAERLADGRVEVGVQQRELDGTWGRVYEPNRRFIPPDAETGRRLHSSPIELNVDDGAEVARQDLLTLMGDWARNGAAYLNTQGDDPLICINIDPRNEGRRLLCDSLEAGYNGKVTLVEGTDPDAVRAELRERIAAGDAAGGIIASSYPGTIVGGQVGTEAGLDVPLFYFGFVIPPLMPDRESTYCILHHGERGIFWNAVDEAAYAANLHLGIESLGLYNYFADGEELSEAIRECINRDAVAIATTLGDPEGVRDALAEASDAGVNIVSYNSGAAFAAEFNSALHIAVDEAGIGRKAGEAFTADGVSGDILCVIHEPDNVALGERCDSLDAAYDGGSVEQLPIYTAEDAQGQARLIAQRLGQGGVGAIFTLGADAAAPVIRVVESLGADVAFGAVGLSGLSYEKSVRGPIDFVIWDQPELQGYLVTAAMVLAEHMVVDPAGWFGGARLTIEPQIFYREDLDRIFGELLQPAR